MLNRLNGISENRYYWLAFMLLAVALEAAALFYQYVLNYGPCILCIHVRIIVMGMLIVALGAFYLRHLRMGLLIANLLMTALWAFLLERSYLLLGVERGFIKGSCGFDSGLPTWFAIDQWFPFMFGIWESCGYTPELLFGITMAEALLLMSVVILLLSSLVTIKFILEQFVRRD